MKRSSLRDWAFVAVAVCGLPLVMAQDWGTCPPQQLLSPDPGASDWFGTGVALDGDTLLVGSQGYDLPGASNAGAVFVYRRIGNEWTYEATLTALDAAVDDYAPRWPCLDGDTAFLGVHQDDVDGRADQGSVNVFVRDGSDWTQLGKIVAADGAAGDNFGWKVQKSGDTLAVSAFRDDDRGGDSGSVYVYVNAGGSWVQQAKLTASDGAAGDMFGNGMALQGDTLLIGADKDDSSRGSLYVFERTGTTWTQTQKLRPPDAAPGDQFGMTITIDGDTAVVGAVWDNAQMGSATVYTREGSTWTQQVKLIAPDPYSGARFGGCVALRGDTLAIGAAYSRCDVYLFNRTGDTWAYRTKITSPQSWSDFGGYIAMNESLLVAGARNWDVGGNTDQGSAWVYTMPDAIPVAAAGPDQSTRAGILVQLDGTASFDDNTPSLDLIYDWTLTAPVGSAASLDDPASPTPSFMPDLAGTYVATLIVTDSQCQQSMSDEVVVSTNNLAPTPDAGDDLITVYGWAVPISGSGSSDPEQDPLTCQWTLVSAPDGSAAWIDDETAMDCLLYTDLQGDYVVQLVVADFIGPGEPDYVTVTAITGEEFVENVADHTRDFVLALPSDAVTSAGNQEALGNFLTQVIRSVQQGKPRQAIKKLEDCIERTDGWSLRGAPDTIGPGRDWIIDEAAARQAYEELMIALAALQTPAP